MDEESQVAELKEVLDDWKRKRNGAVLNDNEKEFDEMQAKVEQA